MGSVGGIAGGGKGGVKKEWKVNWRRREGESTRLGGVTKGEEKEKWGGQKLDEEGEEEKDEDEG